MSEYEELKARLFNKKESKSKPNFMFVDHNEFF